MDYDCVHNYFYLNIMCENEGGTTVLPKTLSFRPMCTMAVGEALGLFHALQ